MKRRILKFIAAFLIPVFTTDSVFAQLQPAVVSRQPSAAIFKASNVNVKPSASSVILKGLTIDADNPFRFEFIVDDVTGNEKRVTGTEDVRYALPVTHYSEEESLKLIKYFLAALAIPEDDMWVNLSPVEKDRIVPETFGQTEMGRDLLLQDYYLKQVTASLLNPEGESGKKFWEKIYEKLYASGISHLASGENPNANDQMQDAIQSFNKVWIVPEMGYFYEHNNTVFIADARLKVMLEEDYLVTSNEKRVTGTEDVRYALPVTRYRDDVKQAIHDIIIPLIEEEVNHGEIFANLRQIYNSQLLALWFKRRLKEHVLAQVYADKENVEGIQMSSQRKLGPSDLSNDTGSRVEARDDSFVSDAQTIEGIWNAYVEAFKSGAANLIKEEYDPISQTIVPRQYFTGGAIAAKTIVPGTFDAALLAKALNNPQSLTVDFADAAMMTDDYDDVVDFLGDNSASARKILGNDWRKDVANFFTGQEGFWQNLAGRVPRAKSQGVIEEIIRAVKGHLDGLKNTSAGRVKGERWKGKIAGAVFGDELSGNRALQLDFRPPVQITTRRDLTADEIFKIVDSFRQRRLFLVTRMDTFEANIKKSGLLPKNILPLHLETNRLSMIIKFAAAMPDVPTSDVIGRFNALEEIFIGNKDGQIDNSPEKMSEETGASQDILKYLAKRHNVKFLQDNLRISIWAKKRRGDARDIVPIEETMEELERIFEQDDLRSIENALITNKLVPVGYEFIQGKTDRYSHLKKININPEILFTKIMARIRENEEYAGEILQDPGFQETSRMLSSLTEDNLRALLLYRNPESLIDDISRYLKDFRGQFDRTVFENYSKTIGYLGGADARLKERLFLRRAIYDPETLEWSSRELTKAYQLSYRDAILVLDSLRQRESSAEEIVSEESSGEQESDAKSFINSHEDVVLSMDIHVAVDHFKMDHKDLRQLADRAGKVFPGTIEYWAYEHRGSSVPEEEARRIAVELNSHLSIFEHKLPRDFRISMEKPGKSSYFSFSAANYFSDFDGMDFAMMSALALVLAATVILFFAVLPKPNQKRQSTYRNIPQNDRAMMADADIAHGNEALEFISFILDFGEPELPFSVDQAVNIFSLSHTHLYQLMNRYAPDKQFMRKPFDPQRADHAQELRAYFQDLVDRGKKKSPVGDHILAKMYDVSKSAVGNIRRDEFDLKSSRWTLEKSIKKMKIFLKDKRAQSQKRYYGKRKDAREQTVYVPELTSNMIMRKFPGASRQTVFNALDKLKMSVRASHENIQTSMLRKMLKIKEAQHADKIFYSPVELQDLFGLKNNIVQKILNEFPGIKRPNSPHGENALYVFRLMRAYAGKTLPWAMEQLRNQSGAVSQRTIQEYAEFFSVIIPEKAGQESLPGQVKYYRDPDLKPFLKRLEKYQKDAAMMISEQQSAFFRVFRDRYILADDVDPRLVRFLVVYWRHVLRKEPNMTSKQIKGLDYLAKTPVEIYTVAFERYSDTTFMDAIRDVARSRSWTAVNSAFGGIYSDHDRLMEHVRSAYPDGFEAKDFERDILKYIQDSNLIAKLLQAGSQDALEQLIEEIDGLRMEAASRSSVMRRRFMKAWRPAQGDESAFNKIFPGKDPVNVTQRKIQTERWFFYYGDELTEEDIAFLTGSTMEETSTWLRNYEKRLADLNLPFPGDEHIQAIKEKIAGLKYSVVDQQLDELMRVYQIRSNQKNALKEALEQLSVGYIGSPYRALLENIRDFNGRFISDIKWNIEKKYGLVIHIPKLKTILEKYGVDYLVLRDDAYAQQSAELDRFKREILESKGTEGGVLETTPFELAGQYQATEAYLSNTASARDFYFQGSIPAEMFPYRNRTLSSAEYGDLSRRIRKLANDNYSFKFWAAKFNIREDRAMMSQKRKYPMQNYDGTTSQGRAISRFFGRLILGIIVISVLYLLVSGELFMMMKENPQDSFQRKEGAENNRAMLQRHVQPWNKKQSVFVKFFHDDGRGFVAEFVEAKTGQLYFILSEPHDFLPFRYTRDLVVVLDQIPSWDLKNLKSLDDLYRVLPEMLKKRIVRRKTGEEVVVDRFPKKKIAIEKFLEKGTITDKFREARAQSKRKEIQSRNFSGVVIDLLRDTRIPVQDLNLLPKAVLGRVEDAYNNDRNRIDWERLTQYLQDMIAEVKRQADESIVAGGVVEEEVVDAAMMTIGGVDITPQRVFVTLALIFIVWSLKEGVRLYRLQPVLERQRDIRDSFSPEFKRILKSASSASARFDTLVVSVDKRGFLRKRLGLSGAQITRNELIDRTVDEFFRHYRGPLDVFQFHYIEDGFYDFWVREFEAFERNGYQAPVSPIDDSAMMAQATGFIIRDYLSSGREVMREISNSDGSIKMSVWFVPFEQRNQGESGEEYLLRVNPSQAMVWTLDMIQADYNVSEGGVNIAFSNHAHKMGGKALIKTSHNSSQVSRYFENARTPQELLNMMADFDRAMLKAGIEPLDEYVRKFLDMSGEGASKYLTAEDVLLMRSWVGQSHGDAPGFFTTPWGWVTERDYARVMQFILSGDELDIYQARLWVIKQVALSVNHNPQWQDDPIYKIHTGEYESRSDVTMTFGSSGIGSFQNMLQKHNIPVEDIRGDVFVIGLSDNQFHMEDMSRMFPNANRYVGVEWHKPLLVEFLLAKVDNRMRNPDPHADKVLSKIRLLHADTRDFMGLVDDSSVDVVYVPPMIDLYSNDYDSRTLKTEHPRYARNSLELMLREWTRILKPGGIIYADYMIVSDDDEYMMDVMREAGMEYLGGNGVTFFFRKSLQNDAAMMARTSSMNQRSLEEAQTEFNARLRDIGFEHEPVDSVYLSQADWNLIAQWNEFDHGPAGDFLQTPWGDVSPRDYRYVMSWRLSNHPDTGLIRLWAIKSIAQIINRNPPWIQDPMYKVYTGEFRSNSNVHMLFGDNHIFEALARVLEIFKVDPQDITDDVLMVGVGEGIADFWRLQEMFPNASRFLGVEWYAASLKELLHYKAWGVADGASPKKMMDSRIQLMHADARNLKGLVADESVQLIFIPAFVDLYMSDHDSQELAEQYPGYTRNAFKQMMREWIRVLKPGGVIYSNYNVVSEDIAEIAREAGLKPIPGFENNFVFHKPDNAMMDPGDQTDEEVKLPIEITRTGGDGSQIITVFDPLTQSGTTTVIQPDGKTFQSVETPQKQSPFRRVFDNDDFNAAMMVPYKTEEHFYAEILWKKIEESPILVPQRLERAVRDVLDMPIPSPYLNGMIEFLEITLFFGRPNYLYISIYRDWARQNYQRYAKELKAKWIAKILASGLDYAEADLQAMPFNDVMAAMRRVLELDKKKALILRIVGLDSSYEAQRESLLQKTFEELGEISNELEIKGELVGYLKMYGPDYKRRRNLIRQPTEELWTLILDLDPVYERPFDSEANKMLMIFSLSLVIEFGNNRYHYDEERNVTVFRKFGADGQEVSFDIKGDLRVIMRDFGPSFVIDLVRRYLEREGYGSDDSEDEGLSNFFENIFDGKDQAMMADAKKPAGKKDGQSISGSLVFAILFYLAIFGLLGYGVYWFIVSSNAEQAQRLLEQQKQEVLRQEQKTQAQAKEKERLRQEKRAAAREKKKQEEQKRFMDFYVFSQDISFKISGLLQKDAGRFSMFVRDHLQTEGQVHYVTQLMAIHGGIPEHQAQRILERAKRLGDGEQLGEQDLFVLGTIIADDFVDRHFTSKNFDRPFTLDLVYALEGEILGDQAMMAKQQDDRPFMQRPADMPQPEFPNLEPEKKTRRVVFKPSGSKRSDGSSSSDGLSGETLFVAFVGLIFMCWVLFGVLDLPNPFFSSDKKNEINMAVGDYDYAHPQFYSRDSLKARATIKLEDMDSGDSDALFLDFDNESSVVTVKSRGTVMEWFVPLTYQQKQRILELQRKNDFLSAWMYVREVAKKVPLKTLGVREWTQIGVHHTKYELYSFGGRNYVRQVTGNGQVVSTAAPKLWTRPIEDFFDVSRFSDREFLKFLGIDDQAMLDRLPELTSLGDDGSETVKFSRDNSFARILGTGSVIYSYVPLTEAQQEEIRQKHDAYLESESSLTDPESLYENHAMDVIWYVKQIARQLSMSVVARQNYEKFGVHHSYYELVNFGGDSYVRRMSTVGSGQEVANTPWRRWTGTTDDFKNLGGAEEIDGWFNSAQDDFAMLAWNDTSKSGRLARLRNVLTHLQKMAVGKSDPSYVRIHKKMDVISRHISRLVRSLRRDQAMMAFVNISMKRKVGGIDLSSRDTDIRFMQSENGFKLPVFDPAMMNVKPGDIVPVILDIKPMTVSDVGMLLGLHIPSENSSDSAQSEFLKERAKEPEKISSL